MIYSLMDKEYTINGKSICLKFYDIKDIDKKSNILFLGRHIDNLMKNILHFINFLKIRCLVITSSPNMKESNSNIQYMEFNTIKLFSDKDLKGYDCILLDRLNYLDDEVESSLISLLESNKMVIFNNMFLKNTSVKNQINYLFLYEDKSYLDIFKIHDTYIRFLNTFDNMYQYICNIPDNNVFLVYNLSDNIIYWSNIFLHQMSFFGEKPRDGTSLNNKASNNKGDLKSPNDILVHDDYF